MKRDWPRLAIVLLGSAAMTIILVAGAVAIGVWIAYTVAGLLVAAVIVAVIAECRDFKRGN